MTRSPTLGMSVLSWRGSQSLDHALKSYALEKLFSVFDRSIIVLPDPDEAVRQIAQKYPLDIHEIPNNIGIAGGMKTAAQILDTDYILCLENDCPLIENLKEAKRQITLSLQALHSQQAIMARLRSRREPGEHFTTLQKYTRYWESGMVPSLRRHLRPAKAARLSGAAIYAIDNPDKTHPSEIQIDETDLTNTSYFVSAKALPWTNQSILIHRKTFLDVIIPHVESQPLKRAVNGFQNIEIELNRSKFWKESGYKIYCPKGLFTHKRLEYRGYT